MIRKGNYLQGQALVLIVFAIVGLVGITALAIDGGNVYSDRRHAQNAADTAALAAGLRKVRVDPNWALAGFTVASDNGYLDGVNGRTVKIYTCDNVPSGEPACVLAPGEAHPENYIQVVITSIVKTYFAPVVGIRQVTNAVQAIAKAVPSTSEEWAYGNALVALMPGCKTPGWQSDPFTISGSQNSVVVGSGVFVNSNCDNAFVQNGNNSLNAPSICVVGGIPGSLTNVSPAPTHCDNQIDLSEYMLPPLDEHSCDTEGTGYITNLGGGNFYAHPGRFSGPFPPGSGGNLKLGQGIYCLQDGIKITGGEVTTDLNNNHQPDANEGALFFVEHGGVDISGNASIFLAAINNTATGLGEDLVNYLMYLPPTNPSKVSITGGSSNKYIGTILAPASLIQLSGGSGTDSLNMETQVIGYSLVLTGSSNLNITYSKDKNATAWTNPELTQYK